VERIETPWRRIATQFPVPDSLPILETLRRHEPRAMGGQPPVVWSRAEGCRVWDAWGNCWLDWSSGVLIANAGHARKELVDAIVAQAQSQLLTTYCFPSAVRARLVERIAGLLPAPLDTVFLLTTGSEAVECAIKLCRTASVRNGTTRRNVIVSFHNAFHGRTLGAQQAGGNPGLKDWIVNLDPGFVQVPFPDGFWNPDTSFDCFEKSLAAQGIDDGLVCGVLMETYQGGNASFAPCEYMRKLREWCDRRGVLLALDEVQAGFGRTGRFWGFEHYGIVPDLVTMGKGISSSLPLSAVAGRRDVMDLPAPGSMTSTHTGNPICCAAALASIELVVGEDLPGRAERLGTYLQHRLRGLKDVHPQIGAIFGKGLVAGVACVRPGTKNPDHDLAWNVVEHCVERGLLLFSPVGVGGATIKICPPLTITKDALDDGIGAFFEAFALAVEERESECAAKS
jgi:4-aminobutyrate aminotransferase/diaminobutyrate-pyruvate transaminase/4-aminobutyrate aminotransferase/(S)-3-amino-2-methylpropionate transaminase